MALSDAELERYSRQLVLPEWSVEAQQRLQDASVLVVGAGALGSAAAGYLTAAGVGRLGVVDFDELELSNLQRQLLGATGDLGANKAELAARRLGALNTDVLVEPYPVRLEEQNAAAMVQGHDCVIDCSDTLETRYLINDACVAEEVALVEGGILGFTGIVTSILPGRSACYRCMFPVEGAEQDRRSCAELGVIGPLGGVIGSMQALEAIKLVARVGEPLTDRILQVEGLDLRTTTVRTERRADCEACSRKPVAAETS